MVVEEVVARGLGGHLGIGFGIVAGTGIDAVEAQWPPPTVVEVVARREVHVLVVILSEVAHALRTAHRAVFAGHVVGHKVENHFHVGLVYAVDEGLPLFHAPGHIGGQVGVHIIIVCYGIG